MTASKEKLRPLSPKIDLENDANFQIYKTYLDDALTDGVHNLAITGKYGSGKSSIIDSYFKKKDNCLKVSFSTFDSLSKNSFSNQPANSEPTKEKNFANQAKGSPKSKILEGEAITKGTIFANIINQIIYQLNVDQIPLTRFKVKKPISNIAKFFFLLELLLFSFLAAPMTQQSRKIVFFVAVINGLFIIWKLLSNFEFQGVKFTYKQVESEINMKRDDLFEKYTDEIVYLFNQSGKSILIIEDLDRFEDLSIFEKLRELNTKLNFKTNKNKNTWTFI